MDQNRRIEVLAVGLIAMSEISLYSQSRCAWAGSAAPPAVRAPAPPPWNRRGRLFPHNDSHVVSQVVSMRILSFSR